MEKMVTMQQDELLLKNYDNIGVLHIPKSPVFVTFWGIKS